MRVSECGFIPKGMFAILPTLIWFKNGSDPEHKSFTENDLTFVWLNLGITVRWGEK